MRTEQTRAACQPRKTTPYMALALLAAALALPTAGAARAASDTDGFLYGKVTTRGGGDYEGRLRWGKQEASWVDHFDATKADRPYADHHDAPKRGKPLKILGITLGMRWDDDDDRVFTARFGDLRRIEVEGKSRARVTMKSGSEYEVKGSSSDLSDDIVVWDESLGKIALRWEEIDRIELGAVPAGLEVDERRLRGTLYSEEGEFHGTIQWDKDECLSNDELDGDTDDGSVSIQMDRIRSIEKRSRGSSRVALRDGRELVLEGSNDVDSDNRGIFVDDPRFGRVMVPWDAFDRLELEDSPDSGPAYGDFAPGKALRGKVTTTDGDSHRGRLIYDLDESETWELLGGNHEGIEYSIPFGRVAAVIPDGSDRSRVMLRGEVELVLEGTADVSDGNAGIVVIDDGGGETYVAWDDIERVDFDG